MTITAYVQQLPVSEGDRLYRELEIYLQRLGHLTPFREELNWTKHIASRELGEGDHLLQLKKAAARNDGLLLIWAKWFKNTVFQHLILHPNDRGFYLPFRFDAPFSIEMKNKKIWFGSSARLLEELSWMEMMLQQKGDPDVIACWRAFRDLCHLSQDHFSPFQLKHT